VRPPQEHVPHRPADQGKLLAVTREQLAEFIGH